jgi:ribonuclease E
MGETAEAIEAAETEETGQTEADLAASNESARTEEAAPARKAAAKRANTTEEKASTEPDSEQKAADLPAIVPPRLSAPTIESRRPDADLADETPEATGTPRPDAAAAARQADSEAPRRPVDESEPTTRDAEALAPLPLAGLTPETMQPPASHATKREHPEPTEQTPATRPTPQEAPAAPESGEAAPPTSSSEPRAPSTSTHRESAMASRPAAPPPAPAPEMTSESLREILAAAGLQWVETDPAKLAELEPTEVIVQLGRPVVRPPKAEEGPLVQVETKRSSAESVPPLAGEQPPAA